MIGLTRTEYRKCFGGSRQSIAARIKRGTLKTTTEKRRVEVILVDDTEENRVKLKALTV
jgi:hypothetical protein